MSTRNAAYIAMMAVILCVCSWLTIPFITFLHSTGHLVKAAVPSSVVHSCP